jgi:HAMP domain
MRAVRTGLVSAIRTASCLNFSLCLIISSVSLSECLTLKGPAQNRYKASPPMPTSVGQKPSSNSEKGPNDRPSNLGACNTARSLPNINPSDEANPPLIYAAISAKPLKALAAADATERDTVPPSLPDDGPTELAAVARSFNAMRNRLTEQDGRRTHMLAAISHDLRTPLANIRLEMAMIHTIRSDSEAMISRQLDQLDDMLT